MIIKTKTGWILLGVALVLIFLVIVLVAYQRNQPGEVRIDTFAGRDTNTVTEQQERELVESWIAQGDYNEYGDPTGTIYALGSPLVDPSGTEVKTLLEYLREQHPDEPWKHL